MSSINPKQSTLPSLASYFPQIASSFSSTQARADDSSESRVQIGNGLMNNLVIGTNNTANNHIYLAASDSKLLETLMLQHIFALQPNIEPLVNLDSAIEKLQKRYKNNLKEDNEVKDALSNYVASEGMELHNSTRFDLKNKVRDFLSSDKKVLLLLGEAGSGKSTFNRDLAVSLWEAYLQGGKSKNMPIPVFIGLSSLSGPDRNLVNAFFEKQGFSKEQIKELQTKHRFVLILDGFDEIEHRQQVFYKDNELYDWKGSKIIISSRPEYLEPNYQYKFHSPGERTALQEYRLAPFSEETIKRYIDRYSEAHPHALWSAEKYKEALKERSLKELVSNPFLLKITLSVLPELSQRGQVKNQRLTRIAIYDQFVESWFGRSQQRLDQILELNSKEREEFKKLARGGFVNFGVEFSQELALEMYQAGEVVTHYQAIAYARWKKNSSATEGDWRRRLLSDEDTSTVLMRLNAPLICQDRTKDLGKEYRFIHKSVRDYFVARALWEETETGIEKGQLLNRLPLVKDAAVLQFLSERVRQEAEFKTALLSVVERSKEDGAFEIGASNAITVLVKAGVAFKGADLKGVQISGADLSFGMFDSAQFEGADLRNANLRGIWLREANLRGTQMSGVEFGELLYLQEKSEVSSCAYSPNGKSYASGLWSGKISVYTTSSWEKIYTLEGHTAGVWSVAYSPCGAQIASGSEDKTVRLWNAQSGAVVFTLTGHTAAVMSVVYSPCGAQIASGSSDKTVRLWDAESGSAGLTLEGHTGDVNSVVYSPCGAQIASGSSDKTVRLWGAESGSAGLTLEGHTGGVTSVVYSPCGAQIASGSSDKTVKLWDAQSGSAVLTLEGHTDFVWSVMYSPRSAQIASGSWDNTVRLWDAGSGAAVLTLEGHNAGVTSVVYSPCGAQIASGSLDEAVRLWDAESGFAGPTLEGHINAVRSGVYSPRGAQIASGNFDKTVMLRDAESGSAGLTLEGHTDAVRSVVYSPLGTQIASGSDDNTIMLWDMESGSTGLTLEGHTGGVWSVVYSPCGAQIASGSTDGTVKLWDAQSGAAVFTLIGHFAAVMSVVYSPCGTQIASGSDDNTIMLWDAENGVLEYALVGHTNGVTSVMYSPCGAQIASGSDDKTVKLWDAESGVLGHTLAGHTSTVWSVVYSPCGAQIASGSLDKTIMLWDAESGALGHTLAGHTSVIWSVVYSPCGAQIASGSRDGTVRLWNPQTGECQILIQDSGPVTSLAWKESSGSDYLGIGSIDKSVRQWKVNREEVPKADLCWSTGHRFLTVRGSSIEGVVGLSEVNQRLLKQRGAALA